MPCFFVMSTYQLKKVFERRISNPLLQVCRALSGGKGDANCVHERAWVLCQC